jgi:hypothetical protein
MNGNGQESRDKQFGTLGCPLSPDAVEAAIAERLEHKHAEEERFEFAATIANATPPVDESFQQTLRARIVAEAAQTMKEKRQMRTIQNRGREVNTGRLYPTLRLAFTLSVTAALLAFVFVSPWGRTLAQSAWQYVAGYVSGIGLVEKDPTLRVLAEPVILTRSDLTVKVNHVLLYSDRTVIHYRVESASTYPFAEPGDDICLEYAYLRLPDGSTLQPQPMGKGKAFKAGYEFATTFTEPIPPDVTQATLIIPCLLDSIRGAAPENWELALRFIPAPPDMDLAPVYDPIEGQTATDQGVTVDLAYVAAEENGYVLNFGLTWDQEGGHEPELYPDSLHVTDATGKRFLLSSAGGRPPMTNQAPEFTFRTSEMPAPGPLTLNLEAIRASFSVHDVSFTFDPGSNPQPGQVWALDEHLSVAGYEWDITSARMVVQDGGPTVGEVAGFEFTMESADPGMMVELLDTAHPMAAYEPSFPQGAMFSSTLTYEDGIPVGPINVAVSRVSVLIPGDWQIRWVPPAEQVSEPD